jgi:hypothetical protein
VPENLSIGRQYQNVILFHQGVKPCSISKTIDSNNTNTPATKEKHLEDLRLKVADAEERLRAIANHAGKEAVVARAGI